MPFLAVPFAAIVGGAIGTVGSIVAAGAGAIFGAGAAAAVTAGTLGLATMAGGAIAALTGAAGIGAALNGWATVAAVASLVGGTPNITPQGALKEFVADPNSGIPYMIGRAACGGRRAAMLASDDTTHKWLHQPTILSGAGPIEEIEAFKCGKDTVAFNGAGAATTGPYAGVMWQKTTLGPTTAWSLPQPAGTGSIPEWSVDHKATGYAVAHWVCKVDPTAFPQGNIERPLWIGKWVKVYDPRLDSSYPGGSGSCDAADESTWVWSDNPYLHALTWAIGRRQNGVVILGVGAAIAGIDVDRFVEGANVCDENGWTLGGGCTSKDSKFEVFRAMLQAGGGVPIDNGGLISCIVQAPRTAIVEITEADLAGPVTRPRQQPRRDRINQVTPRVMLEANDWEEHPVEPYKVDAYITAEGLRPKEIGFPLVQDATQGRQLGAYVVYDTHEIAPISLALRPKFLGLAPGDVVALNLPKARLVCDVMVIERRIDPNTLGLALVCRSENFDKHEEALGLTGAAPAPLNPTTPNPKVIATPAALSWTATAASFAGGSGASIPGILVTGACDNPAAESIIVSWWPSSGVPADGGQITSQDARQVRFELRALTPNETYATSVAYMVRGVPSDPILLDLVTVGPIVADTANSAPLDPAIQAAIDANFDALWKEMTTALQAISSHRFEGRYSESLNRALTHLSTGEALTYYTVRENNQRITETTALLETFDFIGVMNEGGTAFVFHGDQVYIDPTTSLANYRSQVGVMFANNAAVAFADTTAVATNLSAEVTTRTSQVATLTTTTGTLTAGLATELSVRATADGLLAADITTLIATTGSHTASISAFNVLSTNIDGSVYALSGVVHDINGVHTGYRVFTAAGPGTLVAEAKFFVNKFEIVDVGGTSGSAGFLYSGGTLYVDNLKVRYASNTTDAVGQFQTASAAPSRVGSGPTSYTDELTFSVTLLRAGQIRCSLAAQLTFAGSANWNVRWMIDGSVATGDIMSGSQVQNAVPCTAARSMVAGTYTVKAQYAAGSNCTLEHLRGEVGAHY